MIITRYLNKPFLATLIIAFVMLQWSGTHIHLSTEHEHDGNQHQHAATTHQHNLNSHHLEAIDVASDALSHIDSNQVVELENACTQFHGKLSHVFALPSKYTRITAHRKHVYTYNVVKHQDASYQAYHQYTNLNLRAPPSLV